MSSIRKYFGKLNLTVLIVCGLLSLNSILSKKLTASSYWQQRVKYTLTAQLDTKNHTVNGEESLIYYNNSPDTLSTVYFHLYQNAFRKGSYYDLKLRDSKSDRIKKLSPAQEGGTDILSFKINGQEFNRYTIDNTIMRVDLPDGLIPGDSLVFSARFTTKFGSVNRRMHRIGNTYVVAHWYPRIAVYDSHRGWNIDQHLGNEFYGDFGHFNLSITLPANYIVGATGTLLNRSTVLPDSLMTKLDLANFKDKPWGERASVIIPPTNKTKTWHYSAENVHDVAWIASPDFRISVAEWDGIKVFAYAREQHASGWQDAAEFSAEIIQNYSENWGRYEYPKMIVSDVNSGMEYPMLTADGGKSPTYYGLFAHEIAHNWFYGMLGSNETYRAMMDEGFTNFITAVGTEQLLGPNDNTYWDINGNWYQRHFYPRYSWKYARNDLKYMRIVKTGYLTDPLATHSDKFNSYRAYRQVYYKTATMLYSLQYVLGDSLFQEAMRNYVAQWKFKHPYPDDFQRSIESMIGTNLDWFFNEWIYHTHTIDYGIRGLHNKKNTGGSYTTKIDLHRKGFMQMPIDLQVTKKDGSTEMWTIPVNDKFVKQTPNTRVASPWFGWDEINKNYTLSFQTYSPVIRAQIDPSGRLADVNRLDNVSGFGVPVAWHFDNMKLIMPTLDKYDIWLRPSFLYNSVDGLKPGIHWDSSYLFSQYLNWWQVQAGIWYGPMSQRVGYEFHFETPIQSLGRLTNVYLNSMVQEGREWHSVGLFGQVRSKLEKRPFLGFDIGLHQNQTTDLNYVPRRTYWQKGMQRFFSTNLRYTTQSFYATNDYTVDWESSLLSSDSQYDKISAEWRSNIRLIKKYPTRTRVSGFYSDGNPPVQRAYFLAGGSPSDAANASWLYRSRGTLPSSLRNDNHIAIGGGMNLRGYFGQNMVISRGMAFNIEQLLPIFLDHWLPKWLQPELYLFADAGYVWKSMNTDSADKFLADGGAGITIPLKIIPKRLGKYILRFNFPVYVNHPEPSENPLDFRWIFGLGKSW